MDRASQALMVLVGADVVPAHLMPAVVDVLIEPEAEPNTTMGGYICRICRWDVEPNLPDVHEPQCLLAVARPGYGEAP